MLPPDVTTKRCSKCGETKPLDGFHAFHRAKDGLHPWCKLCKCAYEKARNAANPERNRARAKEWRDANLEKAKETKRRYHIDNKDTIRDRVRAWRQANPDRHNASNRRWAAAHPDATRENRQQWKRQNPDHYRALRAIARHRRAGLMKEARHEIVLRADVFSRDNGVCHICQLPANPLRWELDHIVPIAQGGPHATDNVAVSHPWCNRRKSNLDLAAVDRGRCREETIRRMAEGSYHGYSSSSGTS